MRMQARPILEQTGTPRLLPFIGSQRCACEAALRHHAWQDVTRSRERFPRWFPGRMCIFGQHTLSRAGARLARRAALRPLATLAPSSGPEGLGKPGDLHPGQQLTQGTRHSPNDQCIPAPLMGRRERSLPRTRCELRRGSPAWAPYRAVPVQCAQCRHQHDSATSISLHPRRLA